MSINNNKMFDNKVAKMKLLFTNAKLPNIQAKLASFWYDTTKLDELLTELTNLEELQRINIQEHAEQYEETQILEDKRKQLQEIYSWHIVFAKVLFKDDVQAIESLGLLWRRKIAFNDWLAQIRIFYDQILKIDSYSTKFASIGIKKENLQTLQTKVAELYNIKEQQKQETWEAQKSTETRDKALDSLYEKYGDLLSFVKVIFKDEQDLEALGIIVKRK